MSVEAVWDLRTPGASPRSLCVYPAVASSSSSSADMHKGGRSSSNNPFDHAAAMDPSSRTATSSTEQQAQQQPAVTVVFGTDAGSAHARTFRLLLSRSYLGGGSTTTSSSGNSSISNSGSTLRTAFSSATASSVVAGPDHRQPIQVPLGVQQHHHHHGRGSSSLGVQQQQHQQQPPLPRSFYPADLTTPGSSVVACILLSRHQQQPQQQQAQASSMNRSSSSASAASFFLLLLDDNRGTSASQPGAFAAHLACLYQGSFQIVLPSSSSSSSSKSQPLSSSSSSLPRMSCATYHPNVGIVYAAGRIVSSIPSEWWEQENVPSHLGGGSNISSSSSSSTGSSKRGTARSNHATTPTTTTTMAPPMKRIVFPRSPAVLPSPGARSGQDALALTAAGRVALVAVGSSFYAVAGQPQEEAAPSLVGAMTAKGPSQTSLVSSPNAPVSMETVKILSFAQSSQVHPVICLDVQDQSLDADWSCVLLANGRECAVVDLHYGPPSAPRLTASPPRHGTATLASPILAAATVWPWVAVLTSDGLVSIRSPSCLAIPLRTVEVGTQPNDYFVLRSSSSTSWFMRDESRSLVNQPPPYRSSNLSVWSTAAPWIVAASYSGMGKVLQCHPDTEQDLADRLMRHAIDAFGANGFPRAELAEAVHASFTATSYIGVGPESSPHHQQLLQQYLEAVLGLTDWESGGMSGWPTEVSTAEGHHGSFGEDVHRGSVSGRGAPPTVVSAATPAALLTGTALLCLVCMQLTPPNPSLANRAAQICVEKMGIVIYGRTNVSEAAVRVCELVAERLLNETASAASALSPNFSLLSGSSPTPIARTTRNTQAAELVEAAVWLLRACGKHERAIDVVYDRLQRHGQLDSAGSGNANITRGVWSNIKYESYTATHLCELWASCTEEGRRLVLTSTATHRLLENNPRLGLSVFTAIHPQNESQWRALLAKDDPLAQPEFIRDVVKLLKSINPSIPYNQDPPVLSPDGQTLPMESGRALAISYLESAIGIDNGRPTEADEFDNLPLDQSTEDSIASFHDELAYMLLEGVISERRDDDKSDNDSPLGSIYRNKLRRFLRWPLAKIRSEKFMNSLPNSFLQEKALVLGRLGRHEDALRILYRELSSLDLALEYCDLRHERLKLQMERSRSRQHQPSLFDDHEQYEPQKGEDNAYLPLVRVALDSDDTERGTAAAIQVLALRRSAIDRAAALRLLPSNVPVSAVARPFLIPALVDSESQVRRLTVVSALLRARYMRLKGQLTSAQLKAQANLHVVPQLRSLNLGDPLHSTNPFKARTNSQSSSGSGSSSNMPDVMIVKHFFPRHLVIQAKVTNAVGLLSGKFSRTYTDIAFVVAESSEEAIQPLMQVPIHVLPPKMTGSAWCVLSAAPARMEGPTAILTCELRYTIQSTDASSSLSSSAAAVSPAALAGMGRTYVEELQDLEVHASHFS